MALHALTSQASETHRCEFLAGYFTEQFSAGKRPEYGYPKNHLPDTTLENIEVITGFMAVKSSK
ncbi:hypothetical protein V1282_004900 [Nitrobacteraceae bacterium AZCC 2146]